MNAQTRLIETGSADVLDYYRIAPIGGSLWSVTRVADGERNSHLGSVVSGDGEEWDEEDVLADAGDLIPDDGLPVFVYGVKVR